ncbi:MAG: alpha/beta hydrolase-fold protein, partial [Melioribacteraceae bacterium]|nr:alpha/beta hydrolase-fold protein [Melioribacteraceae bacterium]
ALNIFDNLISENRIQPLIAIFVPPVLRTEEYATTQTSEFSSFIIEELMPHIDSTYRTMGDPGYRAMTGISNGGLISTQICYEHPESFGLSAPFSAAYWHKSNEVLNKVLNGPKKNIKWYVDWGSYEGSITIDSQVLVNFLESAGYDVKSNEWHEGHSWGSWRAHLDEALEYFFPYDSIAVAVENNEVLPSSFSLSQNYPNPFNPSTVIKYSIPAELKSKNSKVKSVSLKIYDLLGREVATLVNEKQKPGNYEVEFDPSADGLSLASGIYFYRLQVSDSEMGLGQVFVETKRMILLK